MKRYKTHRNFLDVISSDYLRDLILAIFAEADDGLERGGGGAGALLLIFSYIGGGGGGGLFGTLLEPHLLVLLR